MEKFVAKPEEYIQKIDKLNRLLVSVMDWVYHNPSLIDSLWAYLPCSTCAEIMEWKRNLYTYDKQRIYSVIQDGLDNSSFSIKTLREIERVIGNYKELK